MTALDATELLHLGLHASQHDDPARAIEYLKQCLALEPDHPNATYLLGALYAQVGIYDRAKETLSRAIELGGVEPTAAFQLGLLHLTSGEVDRAASVWLRLDSLPQTHALNHFRFGLLALARDDFAECLARLDEGIRANSFNEALNADMQRIKDSAAAAKPQGDAFAALESQESVARGQHLLGGYRQKKH